MSPKVSLGWWGDCRSQWGPWCLLLLTFLPPAENTAAEGRQACSQEESQQHKDGGQDADRWDGDTARRKDPSSCHQITVARCTP